jgi:hypothetical protein
MILRNWFLIGCLLAVTLSPGQPLSERYNALGTLLLPQWSTAPFPHPARAAGHTYGGKSFPFDPHYSDSTVAIFIPNGFIPGPSTDLVIYFHGWYNSIDSACAQFALIEQFSESKRNAVFVFPEGPKHSPDSFGGRLEANDALKNLIADVLAVLQEKKIVATKKIGRIILAGHSGAFRVMAFCVNRGGVTKHITDVILFDALYAQTEKYARWIEHGNGRFINIYTDDGGTKNESQNLMEDLDAWKIPYIALEDSAVTPEQLRKNRTVFIHSDLSHNGVIAQRRQFREFLKTSSIPMISQPGSQRSKVR